MCLIAQQMIYGPARLEMFRRFQDCCAGGEQAVDDPPRDDSFEIIDGKALNTKDAAERSPQSFLCAATTPSKTGAAEEDFDTPSTIKTTTPASTPSVPDKADEQVLAFKRL